MSARGGTDKEKITYESIRMRITSEHIAFALWQIVEVTKMNPENTAYLLDAVCTLSFDENRQIQLLDTVWEQYYRGVAKKVIPLEVAK